MAIDATHWTINNSTKVIDYDGGPAHGVSGATYATGIEFHRWLQGLADDAQADPATDDFMDMTKMTPSTRNGIDQIIEMVNGFTITQTASEHLYDCSIIQGGGNDIWDGITVIANQGCNCQIIQDNAVVSNDFWNWGITGAASAGSSGSTMEDTGETWTVDEFVGYMIKNTTDGSQGVIISNTADTITADLYGGTLDTFTDADDYYIGAPLNPDAANGIASRFLLKVKTTGAELDGRKIIGTTRVWTKTFSEFKVNGTARGNNVIALQFADDTNNTTDITTVTGWAADFTVTAGYAGIDVDFDISDEYYWIESDINKSNRSINDSYEYWKALTVMGETTVLGGIAGEQVRGVTHEITYSTLAGGPFAEGDIVDCSGGAEFHILADNTTDTMWGQLVTGTAPVDTETLDQGTGTTTADIDSVTEKPISAPFCGASTGSALLGSYGFGITAADVTNNDRLIALDGETYYPPNNQNFYVKGIEDAEDYILVGPINGGETDIEYGQFLLSVATVEDTGTEIELKDGSESLGTSTQSATDTPATGTIRVLGDDGIYHKIPYTAVVVNASDMVFTVTSTDVPTASIDNDVFISYVDELADGSPVSGQESYLATYHSDRDLWVRVRDGGGTPIKTYEAKGTFSSSGGTVNVSRDSDE